MKQLTTGQEQLVQIATAVGTGANILVFRRADQFALRNRAATSLRVDRATPPARCHDDLRIAPTARSAAACATASACCATDTMSARWPAPRPPGQDRADDDWPAARASIFRSTSPPRRGQVKLRVERHLSSPANSPTSFAIRAGEIVGLAGLVGSGRSEVAQAIFGLDPVRTARSSVDGKPLQLGSAREAMRRGLGLMPEDRKRQGLVLMMSCRGNFSLVILDRLRCGFAQPSNRSQQASGIVCTVPVKTPSL